MSLSPEQVARYGRHLVLPEVGVEGQKKLLNARVLCVGAGGLGSPIALYLAAAGVCTLGIADVDVVSRSNLQRQVLYGTSVVGVGKTRAASDRLNDLNPDVRVIEHRTIVSGANVMDLVRDYDVVVDGTDNFPTRYCINDACVLAKKPNVYGSIYRFDGFVGVFAPHLNNPETGERGPCYRCLYPQPPGPGEVPSCAEAGVLGVICGVIGSLQATEAVKLILGIGRPLVGRLLSWNSLDGEFRSFKVKRDPACPLCGERPTIPAPVDYEQFCGMPAINPQQQEDHVPESNLDEKGLPRGYTFKSDWEITPRQVKQMLDSGQRFMFIDCRLPNEQAITKIEGTTLIPLQQLQQRMSELQGKENEKIVVHCKAGGRSMQFAQFLRQHGFKDVCSMAGGISLWNKDINPGAPQY